MRERQGLVFNNNVPTAAMRAGDYSASTRIIHDPLTRQPFPGNVIPANRLSAQALAFAKLVPDPNTAAGTFSWAPVRELNTDQVTVRIDQTIDDSTRIFGRYSLHDQRQADPNAYPGLGVADLSTRGQNVVLAMNNTLTVVAAARRALQLRARRWSRSTRSCRARIRTRRSASAASRRPSAPASAGRSPTSPGAATRR